ncbi:MarR family transcriptional regulator [Thermovirga lienii]|jgi:DNA-binding MarR family transcriptional regulator|uniref:MarR family winged helix-turn-helix transcriptional regulator n=1 Tax=Thermovirga lienii TaxID=336261 RepID=UPI000EDC87D8|nr:MarR family transcriptional regulator [Thermovirga lienii]
MKDKNIGRLLSIIHRNLSAFMDHSTPAEGIGHGQKRLLIEIALNPGRTQEELSELLLKDKTTIARAIKGLEKHGYVRRERNPRDKREFLLFPTEKGLAVLPFALKARDKALMELTKDFTDEEYHLLEKFLRRVAENAVNLRKSSAPHL